MQPTNDNITNIDPLSQQPAPVTPAPKPKSKRTWLIALVLIAAVVIALAIFLIVQFNRANAVSQTYIQDTVKHIYAFGAANDDDKARIDAFRDRVELPDVFLGNVLSPAYREAEEVEKRYTALIDDSTRYFEEFYTVAALASGVEEFKDIALETIPAEADQERRAELIRQRADKLDALAEKIDDAYFASKYMAVKTKLVDNIKKMSQASRASASQVAAGENTSSALNDQFQEAYANASDGFKEVVAYGQEISEYISANDARLDKELNEYIKAYDPEADAS
jgi:hypothetical protein